METMIRIAVIVGALWLGLFIGQVVADLIRDAGAAQAQLEDVE